MFLSCDWSILKILNCDWLTLTSTCLLQTLTLEMKLKSCFTSLPSTLFLLIWAMLLKWPVYSPPAQSPTLGTKYRDNEAMLGLTRVWPGPCFTQPSLVTSQVLRLLSWTPDMRTWSWPPVSLVRYHPGVSTEAGPDTNNGHRSPPLLSSLYLDCWCGVSCTSPAPLPCWGQWWRCDYQQHHQTSSSGQFWSEPGSWGSPVWLLCEHCSLCCMVLSEVRKWKYLDNTDLKTCILQQSEAESCNHWRKHPRDWTLGL